MQSTSALTALWTLFFDFEIIIIFNNHDLRS